MDFQEKEPSWQSLPAVVLVLLLAIGAYWAPWPLEGERPPQMYGGVPIAGIVQQVDARLWQDPFAAGYRHAKASSSPLKNVLESIRTTSALFRDEPEPDLTWFKHIFHDKCGRPGEHKKRRCQTLAVMVFGGPYVGMEEYRRYTRYAVLAGLNLHGFVPVYAERIGYVMPKKDALKDALPALLPFEWLTSEEGGDVLLLWLDEEALTRPYSASTKANSGGKPARAGTDCPEGTDVLGRIAMVVCELGLPGDLRILGPASSGTLSDMADARLPDSLSAARWYSASATSSKAWEKVGKTKLPITRVIAEDDKLVKQLTDELRARGVGKGDTVALVGQWDTAYSRDLIQSLKEKLGESGVETVVAHYLRGIDGQLPGTDAAAKQDDANNKKDKNSVERPEGDAQTDYLRRLAIELARKAHQRDRGIRAVGVLGDDYHDKLLVLKALRHTFPEAVFFTTDLDAAMLHPGDNRYTRNLLVASSFGLTLHPNLQNRFPPFRNSYQTASYAATAIALGGEQLILKDSDGPISPMLFEIGRTAPVRVNNPPRRVPCEVDERSPWHWQACEDWQPVRFNRPHLKTILGTVMTVAAVGLLVFFLSASFRRSLKTHWLTALLGIVAAGALAAWLITQLPSPLGEPFSWIEGVSVWPTEILYVVAVLISFLMIRHGAARLMNGDQETEESFFQGGDHEAASVDRARPRAIDIWKVYRARQVGLSALDTRLAMRAPEIAWPWGWQYFARQNAAPILGFLLLAAGSMVVFGVPHTPARGAARPLDWALTSAALVSFTLLLFFVLDATRRVCWLAGKLAGETSWPEPALDKFGSPRPETAKFFEDWLSLRVIAAATKRAGNLVYYPFLALFLLVFARSSLFDAWHIPVSLLFILTVALVLMVMCAWGLRQTVEKAREAALTRMNDQLLEVQGTAKADEMLEKQIKTMIEQVQKLRTGAFSPLSRQPLVRAILGLASAISGIALLEYASVANI